MGHYLSDGPGDISDPANWPKSGPEDRMADGSYGEHLAKPNSLWFHPRTGAYYVVLGVAADSTNGREGGRYVVYWSVGYEALRVRAAVEFLDGRFVPCKADGSRWRFGPDDAGPPWPQAAVAPVPTADKA